MPLAINVSGEFSDGGEAAGVDRSLGQKDGFDLQFKTNDLPRITILDTGLIGMGKTAPTATLDIENLTTATHGLRLTEITGMAAGTHLLRWEDESGNLRGFIDLTSELVVGEGKTVGVDGFIQIIGTGGRIEVHSIGDTAELTLDARGGTFDSIVIFLNGGGSDWVLGRDDSDTQAFKISQNDELGVNDYFKIELADGDVRIGAAAGAASARLHVDQDSVTGAKPVLFLDQADVSEEMIEFVTTIGVGNAIEAVGAKTLTTTHFIKVTLPGGLTRYFPVGTIA